MVQVLGITSIACYQATLKVRTEKALPQDWARTQMNLANAYSDRIKGDKADNMEQAIDFLPLYMILLTIMLTRRLL
jgi:Tetratricopeptide repeat